MEDVITITKNELKNRYGIDIPKGEYGVNNNGKQYLITQANGDSSGCLLVGENKAVGKVLNSTKCFYDLMDNYLLPAHKRGEEIWISIV